MDLKTCTCSCPYSTFSGRHCENGTLIIVFEKQERHEKIIIFLILVVCPKEDSPLCDREEFEAKCWLYPVVRATCPYMCSLCSRNNSATSKFVNSNISKYREVII